jgi:hypothetical protein
MSDLVLTGLDGANPLGFLAALGVLEVVHARGEPAQLHWREEGGWRPILAGGASDFDDLIGWIDEDRSACISDPAIALEYNDKRDLKPEPAVFRHYLQRLVEQAEPTKRRAVDWASAFATDVAIDNNGNTKPTALHFTAGQQQFLKMVVDLVEGVTPEDIREALVGPWRYERPLPVMGWDATSSRDYALRASNPSTDKKLGVAGADWLAVRGLAFLPAFPVKTRVATTGCVGGWKSGRFRWGLWTVPLRRDVVRSCLQLQLEDMKAEERAARGIGAVFSCGIKRSDQGGYGSFEPAAVV